MKILGLETSCDETSAAVVADGREILSNVISSQIELHRPYGGVVPELAARHHLQLLQPVITEALAQANTTAAAIDAVAATYGPGLASSLLIGLNAGKGLALALGKPFIGINHVEAHLYSPLFIAGGASVPLAGVFPMICLIVSGGHTILARTTAIGRHEILGQTIDDAAGEAFDKVAKLLRLPYPGGPEIDKQSRQGNPAAIEFPRSMIDDPSYNFSFSGIKTSVLYFLRKHPVGATHASPLPASGYRLEDICASFQEAVVDVLVAKTIRAARHTNARTVTASGGVSINHRLRTQLTAACQQHGLRLLLAPPHLCTDNAAMIAALAFHKLQQTGPSDLALDIAPSIGLGVAEPNPAP